MILSKKLSVADPVYRDLARIKAERTAELGRQVTFSEVLADVIRVYRESHPVPQQSIFRSLDEARDT